MVLALTPDFYFSTYDPKTGTKIASYKLFTNETNAGRPHHDGRFMWIQLINIIYQYEIGKTPSLIALKTLGHTPNAGIWMDDRFLWTLVSTGRLRQLDKNTMTIIALNILSGVFQGLTGDGRTLWTQNRTGANIEQYDPNTATLLGGFASPANTSDLHHDGRFLWILTGVAGTQGVIRQYDPKTGTEIGNFNVENYNDSGESSWGITGDGRFLYITEAVVS